MSLLDELMVNCTMIDIRTISDGEGGFDKTYTDGASFKCACTLDTSTAARVAESQGVKNLYTATTPKNVNLQFHNIFRREEDGKIFRVTSDGDDKKTPNSASLDMRQVSCEEWSLDNE